MLGEAWMLTTSTEWGSVPSAEGSDLRAIEVTFNTGPRFEQVARLVEGRWPNAPEGFEEYLGRGIWNLATQREWDELLDRDFGATELVISAAAAERTGLTVVVG